jgi:hypothetical protein
LENIRHSIRIGLRNPRANNISPEGRQRITDFHSVPLIDDSTGKTWKSITEAAADTGIRPSTLRHYVLGTRKNKTSIRYLDDGYLEKIKEKRKKASNPKYVK